uniref:Uncharacterized protein LOC100181501 n=1 Tax=Phallusia mammillata TaxID=59560 RepID=A0A6F9DGS2_9ASCI|nr:uncharacterized protein LOC100181501 [Phallusia mammillata]
MHINLSVPNISFNSLQVRDSPELWVLISIFRYYIVSLFTWDFHLIKACIFRRIISRECLCILFSFWPTFFPLRVSLVNQLVVLVCPLIMYTSVLVVAMLFNHESCRIYWIYHQLGHVFSIPEGAVNPRNFALVPNN